VDTLRGVPATREAYNSRPRSGKPSMERSMEELVATPGVSVELPSTYYLGAQARSAENVSFRDVARLRFLLHFWPFVVPIYVPAVVGRDGEREFAGYAIVVPDVANLEDFVAHWNRWHASGAVTLPDIGPATRWSISQTRRAWTSLAGHSRLSAGSRAQPQPADG